MVQKKRKRANNEDSQKNALGPLDEELERVRQEDGRDQELADNITASLGTMTSRPIEKEKNKTKKRKQARRLTDDTLSKRL